MTAKTPGERLVKIEENIKYILRDMETLQKSINSIVERFDENKKANSNMVWSIVQPILATIIGAVIALAFSGHIVVQ